MEVPSFAKLVEYFDSEEKALYVNTRIKVGQVLSKFGVKQTYRHSNYLTVQVGENEHIMLVPEFLQYINHSCEPNLHFNPSEGTVTTL
ncbi:MAG: hypothetical protein AAGD25_17565 [Cyanobacteria bacterium P01_F01_bin.150]